MHALMFVFINKIKFIMDKINGYFCCDLNVCTLETSVEQILFELTICNAFFV